MGALQAALELDSSGTSQQLAALRKQGLVESRREGTSVYYRVKDRATLELLELAKADHHRRTWRRAASCSTDLAGEDFGPPRARAGRALTLSALEAVRASPARRRSLLGGLVAAARRAAARWADAQAVGMALLGGGGAALVAGDDDARRVHSAATSRPALGLDPLSGFFLARARGHRGAGAAVRARLPRRRGRLARASAR